MALVTNKTIPMLSNVIDLLIPNRKGEFYSSGVESQHPSREATPSKKLETKIPSTFKPGLKSRVNRARSRSRGSQSDCLNFAFLK